jgi:hypothetical protein
MTSWTYVDTRRMGALSRLLDGLFHIIPSGDAGHSLGVACWCEPRVIWSPEAGTAIVSHWRVEPVRKEPHGAR